MEMEMGYNLAEMREDIKTLATRLTTLEDRVNDMESRAKAHFESLTRHRDPKPHHTPFGKRDEWTPYGQAFIASGSPSPSVKKSQFSEIKEMLKSLGDRVDQAIQERDERQKSLTDEHALKSGKKPGQAYWRV